jgi:uncharacterized SAM-binding protein YcdF (DUF218 family)
METRPDRETGAPAARPWLQRLLRALAGLVVAAVVLLLAGFGLFRHNAMRTSDPAVVGADGIVVLTGGTARIDKAVALLADGQARRLLITGVHPQTSERQLIQLTGSNADLFSCCVDIDRTALDTRGNADEAKRWTESHGFRKLLVVTSDYHMPRALLEFSRRMPDVALFPYPVSAGEAGSGSLRLWLSEYAKYVLALTGAPVISR